MFPLAQGLMRQESPEKARLSQCNKKARMKRAWMLEGANGCQSKTGVSTPSTLCSFGLVVVYCK